jgi:NAD(P)-dependent dehydrogenase (short-subunit alcohol dehydrogenase family)
MSARTVLVTGATRGIGRELVRQLAEIGWVVFATGRDEALLATLCGETKCFGVTADLADPVQVEKMYRTAATALGAPPWVLVNNAGFNSRKAALVDSDPIEFERQFAVNLRAPYLLCRLALADMIKRKGGHIVNVISTTVKSAKETMGIYITMKHGLNGLTQVLIKEARPYGIKVTAIYPGGTNTEFRVMRRPDYISAKSAARMICYGIEAPDDVVVHELTYRPLVETSF